MSENETKLNIPPEMRELMEKSIEAHFAAYWQKHATPEQEAKRKEEKKTFRGAAVFVRSVAEKYKGKATGGGSCVAMPDEVAYWLLMEYMEHGTEGTEYKTPAEIEAEAEREERNAKAEADRKRREENAKKKAEAARIAARMAEAQLSLF